MSAPMPEGPLGLTWDEVRKRSEGADWKGRTVICGDCYFMFAAGGVPCRKHTLPGEVDARDRIVNRVPSEVL